MMAIAVGIDLTKNIATKIGADLTVTLKCKTKEKFTRCVFCDKNISKMVSHIFGIKRDNEDESGNYYYLSYSHRQSRWQFTVGSDDCLMYIEAKGKN